VLAKVREAMQIASQFLRHHGVVIRRKKPDVAEPDLEGRNAEVSP
jgi:hypothetical protein